MKKKKIFSEKEWGLFSEELGRKLAANLLDRMVLKKEERKKLFEKEKRFLDDVLDVVAKNSAIDSRFVLHSSFKFTVPANYNYRHQLKNFLKTISHQSNINLTSIDYNNVSRKLVSGREYGVRIFKIAEEKRYASFYECLNFLMENKAILIGAQGLSLVAQLKKDYFPNGMSTFSLDREKALWSSGRGKLCSYFLPFISLAGREQEFGVQTTSDRLSEYDALLCVCELKDFY